MSSLRFEYIDLFSKKLYNITHNRKLFLKDSSCIRIRRRRRWLKSRRREKNGREIEKFTTRITLNIANLQSYGQRYYRKLHRRKKSKTFTFKIRPEPCKWRQQWNPIRTLYVRGSCLWNAISKDTRNNLGCIRNKEKWWGLIKRPSKLKAHHKKGDPIPLFLLPILPD